MSRTLNGWASSLAIAAIALTGACRADRSGEDLGDQARNAERTPAWITTKIQAQYFVNPDIKPWNIDVSTRSNGTVTLRGEVDDHRDRQQALDIARNTEGVTQVDDQLRVRGEQPIATAGTDEPEPAPPSETAGERNAPTTELAEASGDAWTTTKIQSKYFMDDEVRALDIDVSTSGGNVTLSGSVPSDEHRRQAEAIARSTEGVRQVTNSLRVDPSAGGRTPGGTAMQTVKNPFSDEWLETKLQAKFFLDDVVKGEQIAVAVRDGVVTLTGRARSEDAKRAAVAIAQGTEGVKQVQDQIAVGG